MTGSARTALLFLDVDGPLLPFGAGAPQAMGRQARPVGGNPLLDRLAPGLGARLRSLPCELVWATAWMDEANETIAPLLGLPELPVVDWPEPSETDEEDEWLGLHWKTRALLEYAGEHPFAWVDDEITDADRTWVAAHHRAPTLLHRVDPCRGLTETDFAVLDAWLRRRPGSA